jgi:hypothetical protein
MLTRNRADTRERAAPPGGITPVVHNILAVCFFKGTSPRTTRPGDGVSTYLALTFSTLLSSQGTEASFGTPVPISQYRTPPGFPFVLFPAYQILSDPIPAGGILPCLPGLSAVPTGETLADPRPLGPIERFPILISQNTHGKARPKPRRLVVRQFAEWLPRGRPESVFTSGQPEELYVPPGLVSSAGIPSPEASGWVVASTRRRRRRRRIGPYLFARPV